MIRLAKLVAGRLDEHVQDDTPGERARRQEASHNYGISRLGLTGADSATAEALRPSFGDELERRIQTPALPARKPDAQLPAPGDRPGSTALAKPAGQPAPPARRSRPYKKTSAKLPRHMATRLKAYAQATASYQYAIITEALGRFLDEAIACLPPETRDEVGDLEERFMREEEEGRRRWRDVFTFRWK
jgi:hypothetical protein